MIGFSLEEPITGWGCRKEVSLGGWRVVWSSFWMMVKMRDLLMLGK
jgi:hypothetical protein